MRVAEAALTAESTPVEKHFAAVAPVPYWRIALAGSPLPITPLQILWINRTTAILLGLTLAFEPAEACIVSEGADSSLLYSPR